MAIENYLRTGIVNKPTDLSYLRDYGLLLACNFIPAGGAIPDISGSGNDGTVEGSVSQTPLGVEFDSIYSDQAGYVPINGAIAFGDIGMAQTVCMNIKWKHAGNTSYSAIFQTSAGQYAYFDLNAPKISGAIDARILVNGFEGAVVNAESGWNTIAFVFDEPIAFSDFYLSKFTDGIDTFGNYEIRDLQVWDKALTDEEIQNYTDEFGEIIVYADFSAEADGTSAPKDFIITGGSFSVETQNGNQNKPYLENGDKYLECVSGPGYIGAPISDPYSQFEVLVYKDLSGDIFDWHVWSDNVGPLDLDLYRAPGAFYGGDNGINIRWEADGKFRFYFVHNYSGSYDPGQQVGYSQEIFEAGQWVKLKLTVGKTGRFMLYVNDTLIDNLGVGAPQTPAYTSFVMPANSAIAKLKVTNADYVTKDTLVDILRDFAVSGTTQVTANAIIEQWGYTGYTAQYWELYRSPNGIAAWSRIASVPIGTNSYVDTTTGGNPFYYKARLVSGNMYGGFSKIMRAGGTVLATPYNFYAFGNGDEGRILFTWNNNGVTDATSIQPQLSTDGVVWTTLDSLPAGTTQYQAIHQGSTKKYYTRVRVTRGAEEVFTNTVIATTGPAIKEPSASYGILSASEVEIYWSDSGPFGPFEGQEAWRVFKSYDGISYFEIYNTNDINVFSYIDTSPGAIQYYKVAADDGRLYVYSQPMYVEITIAAAPTDFALTAIAGDTVTYSWTNNDSGDIQLEYSPDGGTTWVGWQIVPEGTTSYNRSGLNSETTYWGRVSCLGGTVPSPSNADADTTPMAAPILNDIVRWSDTALQLQMSVGDPLAAPIDHFSVWRSTDGVNFSEVASPTSSPYLDEGLSVNTQYWYKIRSDRFTDESTFSATQDEFTLAAFADPYSTSVNVVSSTELNVHWYNSTYNVKVEVYRSTDNITFNKIGEVTGNNPEDYNDTTCLPNTTYYYNIQASDYPPSPFHRVGVMTNAGFNTTPA